jgi:3-oxoadipate enol-lactonase
MRFEQRTVVAVDGTELVYWFHAGSAREGPVVGIPGLGMAAQIWFQTFGFLRRDRPVAVIDPRGSGRSSDITAGVDGRRFADDAALVLDDLGWAQAHVAGVSMGGMIAQHLAVAHRERVRSLALVCTYGRAGAWTELVWRLRLRLDELGDTTASRLAASVVLTGPNAVEANPMVIESLEAMWSAAPSRTSSYRAQMTFCATHDLLSSLGTLAISALVVSGGRDLLCPPSTSHELADVLSARFVDFPIATHLLLAEQPRELAATLDDHFALDYM